MVNIENNGIKTLVLIYESLEFYETFITEIKLIYVRLTIY